MGGSVERVHSGVAGCRRRPRETVLIISADAMATHQSVVNVLDAARRAGLARLTFAAQAGQ